MRWLSILNLKALIWFGELLAALISLATLQNALDTIGYPAVVIFVMIESSGIPFPGETMLLLASFYAGASHQLQIPIVVACAAFGAIIGDNIGYYIGRTGGRAFVVRFGKYVFIKPEHLVRAEEYFAKHGDKTVFFGRFIAVLRAWAAFLAGVNNMHWRTFLFYNAAGGILWAATIGTLGYVAGRFLHDNFAQVEQLASISGWFGAGLVVAAAVAVFIVYRVRKTRYAQSLAKVKNEEKQEEELRTGL
jgi:membrane protein DedA with SNARE-associated domain